MDHKDLAIEDVKEVEEVKEPVGAATTLHRMKSVLSGAVSAHTFSAGIKMHRLRFLRELQSNVRRCLDSADFRPHGWSNSSSARIWRRRPYGSKPRAKEPTPTCNLARPRCKNRPARR